MFMYNCNICIGGVVIFNYVAINIDCFDYCFLTCTCHIVLTYYVTN